ncbi:hypothetical protein TNCV_2326171 [Trichonephila clavipes]|nr:hypothetical protein TNCV_2326171 [Trichonephila clavipes]
MLLDIHLALSTDGSTSLTDSIFHSWLACSPNISLIENLGDEIVRGNRRLDPIPFKLKALESAIPRIWSQIPHTIYQRLIDSIP